MKYMLLIYNEPDAAPAAGTPEAAQQHQHWISYSEELAGSGKLVAGDALESTDTATTVRVRAGDRLTTDGPFAETKEVLGGYYVVDAPDLDTALAVAKTVPARFGGVEVRPVMTFD